MTVRDADIAAARAVQGEGAVAAWAPGRCTLVGDHLDYVGGRVLVCTLDAGVAVALAASSDGRWRVRSGDLEVTSDDGVGEGIALLPLAAVAAMHAYLGTAIGPLEIAIAASLPFAAGLSSSAAITSAVIAALGRRTGVQMSPRRLADLAWTAEHDIAGIACGRLDQRAVVESPVSGVCAVDLGTDTVDPLDWPWSDVVLVVADSGERHDVGAPAYTSLRSDADEVLRTAGAGSLSQLTRAAVDVVPGRLRRRAQHLDAEHRRVGEAEAALTAGDPVALGRTLTASHHDQRELLGNSTERVDAMVAAAGAVQDCHGARMVGAGFGGCVVALCGPGAVGAVMEALGTTARVAQLSPGLVACERNAAAAPRLRQR